jgi:hypothetical protein
VKKWNQVWKSENCHWQSLKIISEWSENIENDSFLRACRLSILQKSLRVFDRLYRQWIQSIYNALKKFSVSSEELIVSSRFLWNKNLQRVFLNCADISPSTRISKLYAAHMWSLIYFKVGKLSLFISICQDLDHYLPHHQPKEKYFSVHL